MLDLMEPLLWPKNGLGGLGPTIHSEMLAREKEASSRTIYHLFLPRI